MQMLTIENIEVVYDTYVLVLKGLSLQVKSGAVTALLGANGAGKTTTLKAISGLLESEEGEVTRGRITFDGVDITRMAPDQRVASGLVQVMEGRRIFQDLSVEENIRIGAFLEKDSRKIASRRELVYEYFPKLKERHKQVAGYLSGGEQQMLAIGRALMAGPKIMMLDEPSMGLSPLLVQEVCAIVRRLNREEGLTILLVEQNASFALAVADQGYVMEDGKVVLEGSGAELRGNQDVQEFYLGAGSGERGRFSSVKWYRRKKRWV
jgi:branched-chain amino acid transport system ATP-binding protein